MVKGWLAVSLGFGDVLVAPVLHSVIFLISTLTWGAWERGEAVSVKLTKTPLCTRFFDTINLLGAGESRADWNYSGWFYTTTLIYCLSMPWIESDGVDGRLRLALRPFQWPWLWRHFLWACWWNKKNQTYLSDISGELLHIQYLNFPFLSLCFSFLITNITRTLFLFDFRTTWFISPHSLSDTWRWIVWWCMKCCFLSFVCKPNVNDVLYWVCQPHSLWSQALSLS